MAITVTMISRSIVKYERQMGANGCKWSMGSYHEAVQWGIDYLIKAYFHSYCLLQRDSWSNVYIVGNKGFVYTFCFFFSLAIS